MIANLPSPYSLEGTYTYLASVFLSVISAL